MIRLSLTKEELNEAISFLHTAVEFPGDAPEEEVHLAASALAKMKTAYLNATKAPAAPRVLTYVCSCGGKVSGRLRKGAKTTVGACEKCGKEYRLHAAKAVP